MLSTYPNLYLNLNFILIYIITQRPKGCFQVESGSFFMNLIRHLNFLEGRIRSTLTRIRNPSQGMRITRIINQVRVKLRIFYMDTPHLEGLATASSSNLCFYLANANKIILLNSRRCDGPGAGKNMLHERFHHWLALSI